jgi:hypothetical protein
VYIVCIGHHKGKDRAMTATIYTATSLQAEVNSLAAWVVEILADVASGATQDELVDILQGCGVRTVWGQPGYAPNPYSGASVYVDHAGGVVVAGWYGEPMHDSAGDWIGDDVTEGQDIRVRSALHR